MIGAAPADESSSSRRGATGEASVEPRGSVVAAHRAATRHRSRLVLLGLFVLLLVCIALASSLGAYSIPVVEVVRAIPALFGLDVELPAGREAVLVAIRWPRVVLSVIVGAALGLVGVAVQGIFRNPLAAPEVIGTSSGAAFGAAIALVGLSSFYPVIPEGIRVFVLPFMAFVGALGATVIVYRAGRGPDGSPHVLYMLLTGIGVNAIAFAFVGMATALSTDTELRSLSLWMLGSLSGATWTRAGIIALTVALFAALVARRADSLDALLLGEDEAFDAGEDPRSLKRSVILGASVVLGVTVAFTGLISFIGLVIPHAMRSIIGATHRALILASMLGGAILLVVADTVGRVAIAPAELPPGVVTGLVGAPVFLLLLRQARRGGMEAQT